MIAYFLAETAAADPMIPGTWVTGFIVAVLGVIGGWVTKGKIARTSVEPNPLPVEVVESLATKEEMRELEGRLVSEIRKLENALGKERDVARTANGNLHARIDRTSEAIAGVTGQLSQMNSNLDRLLDLATKPLRRTP